MTKYELMLLSASSEKENEKLAKENFKKVTAFISTLKAQNIKEVFLGEKTLAYAIRKNTRAFFTVINFSLSTEKAKELSQFLNLQENIIRYLLTKVE